jgi:alpha-tubulin suppressor-like RCC1 family protein
MSVTPKNVLNTNAGAIVLTNTNVSSTSLYSYGNNLYGEIGTVIGTGAHTLTVSYTTPVTLSVTAGLYHSLFLLSTGQVYSFGLNNYGQLGLGHLTNQTENTTATLTDISSCCCGLYSSYFLSKTGVVSVCGYNFNSELGTQNDISGNTVTFNYYYKTPVQLKGTHTLLCCGYYHSIRKTSDGIYSAGLNTGN